MILHGDCLEVLKTLPDSSCDSLVTDPPAGISFMGKDWDGNKGGRDEWIKWMADVMRECHRVLKPGAHGLVWALPRTSHWTAMALEDAGFEVRDCVYHLFGQGFPKSLDISKAIDKAAGAEREVLGPKKDSDGRCRATEPKADKITIANGRTMQTSCTKPSGNMETAPATDDAKKWQGFGTALKPAVECWWLVRKPLSEKTVAANVLKHGTGGLNIDGSRIGVAENDPNHRKPSVPFTKEGYKAGVGGSHGRPTENLSSQGRFPSHLVLSHSEFCTDDQCDIECAISMLDEQSGTLKSGDLKPYKQANIESYSGSMPQVRDVNRKGDSGGASRFFYTAKISSSERNAACENKHPTVKPQKLMRYLIKLVTPPGGLVLDPFTGSGSTGVAAVSEGFKFIGIEREAEYTQIAEKRIYHAIPKHKKQYAMEGESNEG